MVKQKVSLVGIVASGPGAGKDTLVEKLHELGIKVVNVKFADSLGWEVLDQFEGAIQRMNFWEIREGRELKDRPFNMWAVKNVAYGDYYHFLIGGGHDPNEKRSLMWHFKQYGTDYIREHLGMQDHWSTRGLASALEIRRVTGRVPVISDVRNPNEAEAIRKEGGALIYLDAPWAKNERGDASIEGLIDPEDCDMILSNEQGEPHSMVSEFLKHYELTTIKEVK